MKRKERKKRKQRKKRKKRTTRTKITKRRKKKLRTERENDREEGWKRGTNSETRSRATDSPPKTSRPSLQFTQVLS